MRCARALSLCVGLACVLAGIHLDAQTESPRGGFTFRADRSRTIGVAIAEVDGVPGIVWPEFSDARWDTALLGVQITADAASPMPFVEVSAGDLSDRQYFAPGDAGERWLNLSFIRRAVAGTRIALRAEGIAFSNMEATLRMFASNPDLTKSILVLAPHPDDAEIAAFGLYAQRNASVVTVTAGNAGAATYEAVFDDLAEHYLFKGRMRVIDSITVPWHGGIPPARAFNMGYFDARLAEMYARRDAVIPEMYRPNSDINVYRKDNIGDLLPRRPRESKWSHLVEDMVTLLRKVKPAIVAAPHPQLDTHRDHQFTAVALSEALSRWNRPVTLLLYTNHADRNRYPYGPAGTLMSLPPPPGEVTIDRLYSLPLSPSIQRLKLFALESMRDLRLSPTRQYQLARPSTSLGAGEELRALLPEKPGPPPDITYLRRGPRSNELFYVYDRETFAAMVTGFLATSR